MLLWNVRSTPLLKEYLSITESAKILSLRRNKKQTVKIIRHNGSSFRDISKKQTVTVRNKFDTLREISERHTLNNEYEYLVTAHMKAATECIPIKPKVKCKVPSEPFVGKREKLKKKKEASLPKKRNLTNVNA